MYILIYVHHATSKHNFLISRAIPIEAALVSFQCSRREPHPSRRPGHWGFACSFNLTLINNKKINIITAWIESLSLLCY